MIKGNKGEWSEVYTLIKLLGDGKLYAADENLEKLDDVFYPIIKILRNEVDKKREYVLNGNIKIVDPSSNETISTLSTGKLLEQTKSFFQEMIAASGASFALKNQENLLQLLDISKLKAKSQDKSDITLVVHDLKTGKKPTFGFSIKSLIGKNSTLFNAAPGTNFIFKLIPGKTSKKINVKEFNKKTIEYSELNKNVRKIGHRIDELERLGYTLGFDHIESENLELNLELIDSSLPRILAEMLYCKNKLGMDKLKEILPWLNKENPLNFNLSRSHPFYKYKIQKLLTDCALGMTPEVPWTGDYDATGGIILVKKTGDVLCYHIYNKTEFNEYLLNNTKLEQASTGEDKLNPGNPNTDNKSKKYYFGWIYEENGHFFIKMNLQIRFN